MVSAILVVVEGDVLRSVGVLRFVSGTLFLSWIVISHVMQPSFCPRYDLVMVG